MNNEPITKQQAIDLANRLQAFIGIAGASLYSKEVERLPSCWISVKDRLPKADKTVLLARSYRGKRYVETGTIFSDGTACSYSNEYKIHRMEHIVTHWMPLPEPPKE